MDVNVKLKLLSIVLALTVTLASVAGGWAATQFYKQIAGIGNSVFVGEVTVDDVMVTGPTRVTARLSSNALTEADYPYTATLYLDFEASATTTVSWTAAQIPGVTKTVQFTGLSLGAVTDFNVQVTR